MESIREKLNEIIRRVFGSESIAEVTLAPELLEEGSPDFATSVAMRLAGELKKNPREIAEILKQEFGEDDFKIEIAGPGFLNFTPRDEFYFDFIDDFGEDFEDFEKKVSPDEYRGKTIVCEFSDPNPFKVLHVGHLYTSIVGDAISRLIECAGGKVVRTNFGGDVGLHVSKTIFVLMRNKVRDFSIEDIAGAYVEGTKLYEIDEEAKKKIVQLNKEIYYIAENDIREGDVAEIYWKGRELSYDYFRDFYKRIGVSFDKFYPESTVARIGLDKILEQKAKGIYSESDGAIVFKGENYGLHTRVFVNKDGLPTYEAKDVGLLFEKWIDWKFDESVVITGNDIIDYMKVVLKSVEQYAPELVAKTVHITHGNVRLPGNEKMSSRKGNFIRAVDVLEMVSKVTTGWDIALGAIKYFFLKYKIGGNIVFDVDESVSLTGNSGPYLQYSVVRARKILKNTKNNIGRISSVYTMNDFERKLNKKFVQYPEILRGAVLEKAPHLVANYLFELAQDFSRFYENCPVAGDEFELERKKFVRLFIEIMTHGLSLLGISIPEEM